MLNKKKYISLLMMMYWELFLKHLYFGIRSYRRWCEGIFMIYICRILYVWHIRHPSSGYVQGINDVVTPFIVVYLSDYIEIKPEILEVP